MSEVFDHVLMILILIRFALQFIAFGFTLICFRASTPLSSKFKSSYNFIFAAKIILFDACTQISATQFFSVLVVLIMEIVNLRLLLVIILRVDLPNVWHTFITAIRA